MKPWSNLLPLLAWAAVTLATASNGQTAESLGDQAEFPDAIVVCPLELQPALADWQRRRTAEGLTVRVIEPAQSAEGTRQRINESAKIGKTRYVLLMGDPRPVVPAGTDRPNAFVPTIYAKADATAPYQETSRLPGDHLYGDFDRDGTMDAAVGRLPVTSAQQAENLLRRIAAYEDSQNFGSWRSRVELVAGLGGFGPLIDGAIEAVAAGMITGSLPGSVRTRVTHAGPTSPFCPGPECFTDTVLANYAEGARFWVYAGHGHIRELDRVPATSDGRPVLCADDVDNLNCPSGVAPIALLLACYAGAMDANEDCLAARMLLAPGGPVAVLAGSRVTMPYGNAAAATALIHAVYTERPARLGDAWLQSLNEMATPSVASPDLHARRGVIDSLGTLFGIAAIDAERREHMQLYNWLGDPTMRLTHPHELPFTAPNRVMAGEAITVQGESPMTGSLTIGLHRRLTATPPSANPSRENPGTPSARQVFAETSPNRIGREDYYVANNTVLAEYTFELTQAGPWEATLRLPSEVSGPLRLVLEVEGDTGYAEGSASLWVRP